MSDKPSRSEIVGQRNKSMTVAIAGSVAVDVRGFVSQWVTEVIGKCPECDATFEGPLSQIIEHVKEHAEQEARDRLIIMAKDGRCINCGGPRNFTYDGVLQSICTACTNSAVLLRQGAPK